MEVILVVRMVFILTFLQAPPTKPALGKLLTFGPARWELEPVVGELRGRDNNRGRVGVCIFQRDGNKAALSLGETELALDTP